MEADEYARPVDFLDDDGQVLSTAVLKRYDDRLREISVGTSEAARGRGLAKAVTAGEPCPSSSIRATRRRIRGSVAQGQDLVQPHQVGLGVSR